MGQNLAAIDWWPGQGKSMRNQEPLAKSSSNTLLGFLLDRLALLDVQTIASGILANDELESGENFQFQYENFQSQSGKSSPELIILAYQDKDPHLRPFVHLRPLTSGSQENLAKKTKLLFKSALSAAAAEEEEEAAAIDDDTKGAGKFIYQGTRAYEEKVENESVLRQQFEEDLLHPWPSFKLPVNLVEILRNDLFLHPNLTTKLVLGMIKIEFKLERSSNFVVLNCDQLNLNDITVWRKRQVVGPSGVFDENGDNLEERVKKFTNLSSPPVPEFSQNSLQPIPIRRILINSKLEQIYLEFHDSLEPVSRVKIDPSNLNFGDLPARKVEELGDSHFQSIENVYLINISFNKTNLIQPQQLQTAKSMKNLDSGLEFVHYVDYFAQPEAEIKTILYTQFEPYNARKLFPCFDEPQLKAKFQLDIVHELNHQVLFSAQKREKVPYSADGSLQMSVFDLSQIPISTYLVSFIVCDIQNFKSITSRAQRLARPSGAGSEMFRPAQDPAQHIQVQIVAQFEQLSQAEFASQLVPQLLTFYQNQLNFPFPLDKLDLVAIPRALSRQTLDYFDRTRPVPIDSSGRLAAFRGRLVERRLAVDTMENLGLIWFKAPLLLFDINLISQNLIEQISMIISHQIAHQFFGNIIGLSNWQDYWLYEGLCQYLESIGLSQVQTDWRLEEQFAVTSITEALAIEQYDLMAKNVDLSSLENSLNPLNLADNNNNNNFPHQAEILFQAPAPNGEINLNEQDFKLFARSNKSAPEVAAQTQASDEVNESIGIGDKDNNFSNDNLALSQPEGQLGETIIGNQQRGQASNQANNDTFNDETLADSISSETVGAMAPEVGANLRKSSAVLHMFLFNLLPSVESRAKLLRNCLNTYKFKSMSVQQFWLLFGEQLKLEASKERLGFEWPQFSINASKARGDNIISLGSTINLAHGQRRHLNLIGNNDSTLSNSDQSSLEESYEVPLERTVFVRNKTIDEKSPPHFEGDRIHRLTGRASSNLASDHLDALATAWLNKPGYPLVSASIYRGRLHLRQEAFSLTWWPADQPADFQTSPDFQADGASPSADWNSRPELRLKRTSGPTENSDELVQASSSEDDLLYSNKQQFDQTLWPIPIMYVSKFSPKQANFLWLNKREMEIQLPPFNSAAGPDFGAAHEFQTQHSPYGASTRKQNAGSAYYPSTSNTWFKLNFNQSSLIRVNYDERNWELLTELLIKSHYSNHVLNYLDRANLLDDSLSLMRCGKLSVGLAMNLSLYLEVGERDFMPWQVALKHLDQMQTLLNQNPLWHRYVLKLIQPISSVIGWKDDGPHLMRKLRRSLFNVALQYGDEKLISKAKGEFKAWFKSGRFIVPNLQELVYVAGVRYGDQQEWFHCWQKYQQLVANDLIVELNNQTTSKFYVDNQQSRSSYASSRLISRLSNDPSSRQSAFLALMPVAGSLSSIASGSGGGVASDLNGESSSENEKRQLLTALASTQNTWLLEQFLNYSLDSSKIQLNHLKHVMQTLGKNPVARLYLWRFVRLNWANIIDRYNNRNFNFQNMESEVEYYQILETMIIESTKHFATRLDLDEVKGFFDTKRKLNAESGFNWRPSVKRAIQLSLQVIRSNIYWRDIIEPKLTKWLSHYDSSMLK